MIIKKEDSNHHMIRARYILHLWHSYTSTRKKCVKALVNGINKLFLQYSFTHIRKL